MATSADREIRKLVQEARDRGDVVDVSAFAERLRVIHPDCELHDLTDAILAAVSEIGGMARWDKEPFRAPGA